MCNEWFSYMSKTSQKDVSFFLKFKWCRQTFYSHLPVYSPICMKNLKYENIVINNDRAPHSRISTRKLRWTTFKLMVAKLTNFNYFLQTWAVIICMVISLYITLRKQMQLFWWPDDVIKVVSRNLENIFYFEITKRDNIFKACKA